MDYKCLECLCLDFSDVVVVNLGNNIEFGVVLSNFLRETPKSILDKSFAVFLKTVVNDLLSNFLLVCVFVKSFDDLELTFDQHFCPQLLRFLDILCKNLPIFEKF